MTINHFLNKYDAILISSWGNITYLTSYSGFSRTERECFLLFTKKRKYLITDGRYVEAVNKEVKGFEVVGGGVNNFLDKGEQNILGKLKSIAVEEENLAYSEYKSLKKVIKKIGGIEINSLRTIKNKTEIENIKKACQIADETFEKVIKQLKIGVSEKNVANSIEQIIKDADAQISFVPIVAFGKNSALPHHVSGKTKLKNNQIVLLDFGAKVNNYCSDLSRTFFFGRAPVRFKKMHQSVLDAQKKAIKLIESKLYNHKTLTGNQIDKEARNHIKEAGYPPIPHSVGHGIGIEVHETPYISPKEESLIKPGMVFSIEPGIYLPSFGGVRIEDLVLIKKNGVELISHSGKEIMEVTNV